MEFVLINSFTLPYLYIPQILFSLQTSAQAMTVSSQAKVLGCLKKLQTKVLSEEGKIGDLKHHRPTKKEESLISSVCSINLDIEITFIFPSVFRMEKKL